MSTQWYYSKNDEQFGPVTWDDLRQLASSKEFDPSDLVWNETMPEWSPAETVAELFSGADWFYAQGEQQLGPVTFSELCGIASSGKLSRSDLVWQQSLPEWIPGDQVKGLFPKRKKAPPPLPPEAAAPTPPKADRERTPEADNEKHSERSSSKSDRLKDIGKALLARTKSVAESGARAAAKGAREAANAARQKPVKEWLAGIVESHGALITRKRLTVAAVVGLIAIMGMWKLGQFVFGSRKPASPVMAQADGTGVDLSGLTNDLKTTRQSLDGIAKDISNSSKATERGNVKPAVGQPVADEPEDATAKVRKEQLRNKFRPREPEMPPPAKLPLAREYTEDDLKKVDEYTRYVQTGVNRELETAQLYYGKSNWRHLDAMGIYQSLRRLEFLGPDIKHLIPLLLQMMNESKVAINKIHAARVLGYIGESSPEIIQSLVANIGPETESSLRLAALMALVDIGEYRDEAVPVFIDEIRRGRIGDKEPSNDPHWSVILSFTDYYIRFGRRSPAFVQELSKQLVSPPDPYALDTGLAHVLRARNVARIVTREERSSCQIHNDRVM